MSKIRFVGLDVHADTIAVAVAEPGGEVRSLGVIPNREEQARRWCGSRGLQRSWEPVMKRVLPAACCTGQLRVKDGRATAAAGLRDDLLRRIMASLADSIAAGVSSVIVFNPLNRTRNGMVTLNLDKGMEIADRATETTVPVRRGRRRS